MTSVEASLSEEDMEQDNSWFDGALPTSFSLAVLVVAPIQESPDEHHSHEQAIHNKDTLLPATCCFPLAYERVVANKINKNNVRIS